MPPDYQFSRIAVVCFVTLPELALQNSFNSPEQRRPVRGVHLAELTSKPTAIHPVIRLQMADRRLNRRSAPPATALLPGQ